MDEARFWAMVEVAWRVSEWDKKLRRIHPPAVLDDRTGPILEEVLDSEVVGELHRLLESCSREELAAFQQIQDRLLAALDRDDVHDVLGGSDDGFEYGRSFVVGMGRRFYEAVLTDPKSVEHSESGWPDCEAESLLGLALLMYEDRYGELPPRAD